MEDRRHTGQHGLFGRGPELTELASRLAHLAETKHADAPLLLIGEPGVGKTALLNGVRELAEDLGIRVLGATGVESESQIPFSTLHQLFAPLLSRLPRLAEGHRLALLRAFGAVDGPGQRPVALPAAAWELVRQACADQPVLVVIDDLQWVDAASAAALGFIARRTVGEPVLLLAAARTGSATFFDQARLPQWDIAPLNSTAAGDLLDHRHPGLGPAVRSRVLAEAEGNPLALVELPRTLSLGQRGGQEALPSTLLLSRHLEALFADRMRALSPGARALLLLAALDAGASVTTVRAAAGRDWGTGRLAELEGSGLMHVEGADKVVFHHPLVRSAAVQLAAPEEVRAAHRRLAAATVQTPDRHAWHLAAAVLGTDPEAAQALEDAAHRALRRGGASSAVVALIRAAELSPSDAEHDRRLAQAAYLCGQAGQFQQATQLNARLRSTAGRDVLLDHRVSEAYVLLHQDGDLEATHTVLLAALDYLTNGPGLTSVDGDTVDTIFVLLFICCYFSGRPELWRPLDELLDRLGADAPALAVLYRDALTDPVRTGAQVRARLDREFAHLGSEVKPWSVTRLGLPAQQMDALHECRHHLQRILDRERDQGAIASRLTALYFLALEAYWSGRWEQAAGFADEGWELADAHGYHFIACLLLTRRALVAAARGERDLVRETADRVTAWAAPRRIAMPQAAVGYALTLSALGDGEYEQAYNCAASLSSPGRFPSRLHYAAWMLMDLTEAAARSGRPAQARAHVEAARRIGIGDISPRHAFLVAGAAAYAGPEDQAGDLFRTALSLPGAELRPFEQGRLRLAYGEWLRRHRDLTGARTHLEAAWRALDRLGAQPWAERAQRELRAAGAPVEPAAVAEALNTLTAQELQIARLAAEGLTNRQIGERMHLSPRTVGTHLYKIFPKLGITSRTALPAALRQLPDDRP